MAIINIKNVKKHKVFLVDNKYIVKFAQKDRLLAEKFFIENYQDILPVETIVKDNIKNGFIIYNYVNGTHINNKNDIANFTLQIFNIISKYKTNSIDGYGDVFNLKENWEDFLIQEVTSKSNYMPMLKTEKIFKELEIIKSFKVVPKIIHGDLGSFNLIVKNSKIIGIIDPRTIIGDPLYDFLYFIFSNYNITISLDLYEIILFLNSNGENVRKVLSLMYILLYDRISIEIKNNTHNINNFYSIWNKLESIEEMLKTSI